MRTNRVFIISLFSSIFFAKIALCLATIYFQCDNQKLMNSLIMQVEIEHEDHTNEDAKDILGKEAKFTKLDNLSSLGSNQLSTSEKHFLLFSNNYPINGLYVEMVTPPPEYIS